MPVKCELIEVSARRPTAQSSVDPARAGSLAVATGAEENPWWRVDLGDVYPLDSIRLTGVEEGLEPGRLTVEISRDGLTWAAVPASPPARPGEMSCFLAGEALARQVRLSLAGPGPLRLKRVEVFSPKSDLLLVASRWDALGARFLAIINAVYLAKVLGCEYEIRWPVLAGEQFQDFRTEKSQILGLTTEGPESLFTPEFCRRIQRPDWQNLPRKAILPATHEKIGLTRRDFFRPEFHDDIGLIYAPVMSPWKLLAKDLAPARGFTRRDAFFSLPFNREAQAVFEAAARADLPEDFAAVHVRGGHEIYKPDYRADGFMRTGRSVPLSLARMVIEAQTAEKRPVLLFGQNLEFLRLMKERYGVGLAGDHSPAAGLSPNLRNLFEIVLMSRARKIFAGTSAFATLAYWIGESGIEFHQMHQLFSPAEKWDYFMKDLADNGPWYDDLQNSYSAAYLYLLCREGRTAEELLSALDLALKGDPGNRAYRWARAGELIRAGREEEADRLAAELLESKSEAELRAELAREILYGGEIKSLAGLLAGPLERAAGLKRPAAARVREIMAAKPEE